MSSKFKVLSCALALVVALGFFGTIAKADVTGSFGVNLAFAPIDCRWLVLMDPDASAPTPLPFADQPCENTVYKFDLQTDLNVNVTISGLTMSIHSHAGTTGFEDIILTFATTLGALDITSMFVFAQPFAIGLAPDGQVLNLCIVEPGDTPATADDSCQTLFVKKRVEASISLGGVTFSNLAMFEDVTFPNYCVDFFIGDVTASLYDLAGCVPAIKGLDTPIYYGAQSQNFGFGDVVFIEGQTPSGITVRAETGICAEQLVNATKKHVWDYRVNSDCVSGAASQGVKPPVVFSFEKLFIEGIPLAAGISVDIQVLCGSLEGSAEPNPFGPTFFQCQAGSTWTITGGPLFNLIQISTLLEQILGPASLSDITVLAAGGPLLLIMDIDPADLAITFLFAQANFTINPDTNPASLRIRVIGTPGIAFMDWRLSIARAGLSFFADIDWDVASGSFDFDDLTFGMVAEAGIITVESSLFIDEGGTNPETAYLVGGSLNFTVSF